jgi:hypothetical protein
VLLHPEDYPSVACVRTARPYAAHIVISDIYTEMLNRWEMRTFSAVSS